jgi:hypothetical protein
MPAPRKPFKLLKSKENFRRRRGVGRRALYLLAVRVTVV